MTRKLFLTLLLFTPLVGAQSSDKRDFTGRWRMDKEKSNFAGFKVPDVVVRVVDQHGQLMNVHTVQTAGQKTSISDITYVTDGNVAQNVINGRDAESKTFWDGDVLVINTSMKTASGDDEVIVDRWSVSDDKQTLTIVSHVETTKGGADMTMVCNREVR